MFKNEEMEINMGPQHPSTHGVLRLKLKLDGEVVSRPRLREPLTSGALAIAFPDAAQARAFVEKLRAGKGALGIEAE